MNIPTAKTQTSITVSCRELVRRALLERIGNGALIPGTRIVEARLAEEFGISSIPVREAIRELVSAGVLLSANNRGAWVREVSMTETVDALEVKASLESHAVRFQTGPWCGNSAMLDQLCVNIALAAKRQDLTEYQSLNHQFHRHIVETAGNAILLRIWDSLVFEVRTKPVLEFLLAENTIDIANEHRNIALALRDGRRSEAAAFLAAHSSALAARLRQCIAEEQSKSINNKAVCV